MGSSKIVLVGATSLIVGIYSLSIKKVETNYVTGSTSRARTVQLDRAAEAALRLAVNDLANNPASTKSVRGKKVLGGLVTYTIKQGNPVTVTATVDIGGTTKTLVAYVEKATGQVKKSFRSIHRGKWVVTKYYVKNG